MRSPENRGISRISASPREGTATPVLPRPDLKPFPVIPEPKKQLPKGKKPWIQRLIGNLGIRIGLGVLTLGGAGYGVFEADRNELIDIPGIHQSIKTPLEEMFPRNPTVSMGIERGFIESTVAFSLEEIKQKFPEQIQLNETTNALSFLMPFQLPEGAKIEYIQGASGAYPTDEMRKEAVQKNIKDYMLLALPKDTILVSPVDGYGFIAMGNQDLGVDPNNAMGFATLLHDKTNNTTYLISLSGIGKDKIYNFNSLSPETVLAPNSPKEKYRGTNWKDWPTVKQGQKLMEATEDGIVSIRVDAYRGIKIGPEAMLIDKAAFVVSPSFFNITDSGNQKTVVLGK